MHGCRALVAVLLVGSGAVGCDDDTSPPFQPGPGGTPAVYSLVAAGGGHACGVTDRGTFCWGEGDSGQLGDGSGVNSNVPTPLLAAFPTASVDAGAQHSCGLGTDGRAYCWGSGAEGQLGNGGFQDWLTPALVSSGLLFSTISAGAEHSCGVAVGAAYCWGSGADGRLGTGNQGQRVTPALDPGGPAVLPDLRR